MIVTKAYLNKYRTGKGGWNRKQLAAIGIDWPPTKGWKKRAIGSVITDEKAAVFEGVKKPVKNSKEIINKISPDDGKDWSWKPDNNGSVSRAPESGWLLAGAGCR